MIRQLSMKTTMLIQMAKRQARQDAASIKSRLIKTPVLVPVKKD